MGNTSSTPKHETVHSTIKPTGHTVNIIGGIRDKHYIRELIVYGYIHNIASSMNDNIKIPIDLFELCYKYNDNDDDLKIFINKYNNVPISGKT
eukprot:250714_1